MSQQLIEVTFSYRNSTTYYDTTWTVTMFTITMIHYIH